MNIKVDIVSKNLEVNFETFQPMVSLIVNLKLPLEPVQDNGTIGELEDIACLIGKAIIEEMNRFNKLEQN